MPALLETTNEPLQFQCRHIKTDGIRCGSPALRKEHFCYYHHTARHAGPRQPQVRTASDRKSSTFALPSPADLSERSGVQLALALILHKIANNEIDPRRAGLLLYGLGIASNNLKHESKKTAKQPEPIEEITDDPTHGPLAPEAELGSNEPPSILQRLVEKVQSLSDDDERDPHPTSLPSLQAHAAPNRSCRRHTRKLLRRAGVTASPDLTSTKAELCRKTPHIPQPARPTIQ